MMNTHILPGYLIISSNLHHITPNHNHCHIHVIMPFITQASRFQVKKVEITIQMNILTIIRATIEANRIYPDEKMKNLIEELTEMII